MSRTPHKHRSFDLAPRSSKSAVLLVFLGGVLGAYLSVGARSSVNYALPGASDTTFALALAIVNITGSALLGLLTGIIPSAQSRLRQFAGTGVLGSFTSFSAIGTTLFPTMGSFLFLHGDAGRTTYMEAEGFRAMVLGCGQFHVLSLLIALGSLLVAVGAAWLGLRAGRLLREVTVTDRAQVATSSPHVASSFAPSDGDAPSPPATPSRGSDAP